MPTKIDDLEIAISLTGGQPLAYKQHEDGSLVVVAHTGQKFRFTANQVAEKRRELTPSHPKPATPKQKASTKPQEKQPLESKPAKPRAASRSKPPEEKR